MVEWVTQSGSNLPAIGQASPIECRVACCQMMLKAHGVNWTIAQIENRLAANGFAGDRQARVAGRGDAALEEAAAFALIG
ncbi:MAG TPA: hypothetical protein VIL74_05205 [Pyrinomonadaceae bacterium]